MNYLEPILELIYRIVRLVFGRKRKKESTKPKGNTDSGIDRDQPIVAGNEPAGSDNDNSGSHPDTVSTQSQPTETSHTIENNPRQGTVNLFGWGLIIAGGIAKMMEW